MKYQKLFKTLIRSRFQGMYWCAHKTTTLTSIQHTVPPTSAYVIYEWYLILLFFFINHSPIDYFFAYVFLFQKEKENICTAILLSATQKWVYWISLFSECNSLNWLLKPRFALIPHPKLTNDLWRGQNLFFYFLQNILAFIFFKMV